MPLSFEDFKRNVNKNTKVIVVIHMQGLGVEYLPELKKFCKKKIFLIEDAAPALGTYVKKNLSEVLVILQLSHFMKQKIIKVELEGY